MHVCEDVYKQKHLLVRISVPVFFSVSLVCTGGVGVGWCGGYKVETNSSLGDEGRHNYVQFSS